jgi:hypothetical protein
MPLKACKWSKVNLEKNWYIEKICRKIKRCIQVYQPGHALHVIYGTYY